MDLGAVLAKQNKPDHDVSIAFTSRTLQEHNKNYSSSELEALTVIRP